MSGIKDDLALLRDRTFAVFFSARAIANLGGSFAPVALAFSVLHLPHGSPELLSLVLACESIPMVALMLVGGVIADRLPRSRVLLAGMVLSAASFFCLGFMMLSHWTPTLALGAASALSGVGIALLYPALTGMIPDLLHADQLQAGNALLSVARSGAQIFGLVSSGAVVALVGGSWALIMGASLFLVSGVLTLWLPVGPAHPDGLSARDALADLRDGWREFIGQEWLWVVVAEWSVLVLLFDAGIGVIGPVLADRELGGAGPWSLVLAGEAVGSVIGGLIGMRLRPRRPIFVAVMATVVGVPLPFISLGLGWPLAIAIGGMVLTGLAFGMFGVLWSTTMQRLIAPDALSRVASYDALGSLIFQPVGLLIGGPATVLLGARPAMVVCGAALAVGCFVPLVSRSVRTVTWDAGSVAD